MIELFVQSRYKVDRKKLKRRVGIFLEKMGISLSDYDLSLAIVGDRKMRELNKKYRGKEGTTPVLTFAMDSFSGSPPVGAGGGSTFWGTPFVPQKSASTAAISSAARSPTERPLLGEIVVSYPQALLLASEEDKLVDEKIGELVEHGLAKLLSATS